MSKQFLIILLIPVFAFSAAFSQQRKIGASEEDSLKTKKPEVQLDKKTADTTKADSVISKENIDKDTIPPNIPLRRHGSLSMIGINNTENITKEDLLWIHYASFYEIMEQKLSGYPLSLGGYGLFNHMSLLGSDPRDVSFNFNGRSLNDLEFGSYNPAVFSTEFFERAEIFTGSDAVIFADNSSGALINFQEIRYDTKRPYTRLWFAQAGYDYLAADGIYSQNFRKNWNFTFGFRRMGANNQYANSEFDSWNVRGILRWNISDLSNISLTEKFSNHGNQMNGGIDLDRSVSVCDPILARPLFSNFNRRTFRHDLDLTFSSYLSSDSLKAFTGSVFFHYADKYVNRGEELSVNPQDTLLNFDYENYSAGATARYEHSLLNFFTFRTGGVLVFPQIAETKYFNNWSGINLAGYAHAVFDLPLFKVSGGFRFGTAYGNIFNAFGAALQFDEIDHFYAKFDLSRSERYPVPIEGLNLNNEIHTLFVSELKLFDDDRELKGTFFARHTDSPIRHNPLENNDGKIISSWAYNDDAPRITAGAGISGKSQIFPDFRILPVYDSGRLKIGLDLNFFYSMTDDAQDSRFPNALLRGELYYQAEAGNSIMNLGLRAGFMSGKNGEYFVPATKSYIPFALESDPAFTGLDIFAELKLGNAFVRIMFENVISDLFECYYYVPVYPETKNQFRLTVSWPFFN